MLHGNAETLGLALLAEKPQHGYQLHKELATRSLKSPGGAGVPACD